MAIYDCFQFFNEELILDIRLNILNEFVDFFVITESTTDHQGNKKKLNFNISKFKKFQNKIIYIAVDDTEEIALMTLNQLGGELEHSAPNHKMSALQDLESGKKLEIEETLGYAVSEALKLDLAVPTLNVCYALIKGIDMSNLKTV